MAGLGWPEILGIFAIILLIFGIGRISKIGGELGSGIRAFREGLKGDDEPEKAEEAEEPSVEESS
jgi:sec-independent protein translocase protein TatA